MTEERNSFDSFIFSCNSVVFIIFRSEQVPTKQNLVKENEITQNTDTPMLDERIK